LEWCWCGGLLRCFSELAYKPKLVKVILSESILCGFQGCNIFRLMGKLVASRASTRSWRGWTALEMISWSWDPFKTKIGSEGDTSACCATWAKLFILAKAISDILQQFPPSGVSCQGVLTSLAGSVFDFQLNCSFYILRLFECIQCVF